MSFANWLKCHMEERCETAYRLSKEIGVSQTTVANWLNGANAPQLASIGKLADHFECSAIEILKMVKA